MSNIKGKVQEIDIIGLLLLLWDKRKRILTNCAIAVALAIVVAFSIPKEYTSTVVMAPEMSSKGGISSGLGAMASMVGVNLNGLTGSEDAFYPEIYPQIVSSTPFLMDIMKMQVESIDGEIKTNMYDYLCHHVKTPWWFKFYSVPLSFFKRLFTAEEDAGVVTSASSQSYNMKLSKKQFGALAKLEKSILVSVDKGNSVITINVTMQDPKITACVANEVAEKLKKYIEDYRSAKARKDMLYVEELYNEFKVKYVNVQKEYADYVNLHQNVVNKKYQIEIERLENEVDLAFGIYSQMAQNLEVARAKVQENMPVCVVIEPSYIQIKASSPKKIMTLMLYVFLAFFGTSAWIVIKDRIIKK